MATDATERLHYYQRQYLGAEDFEAQQAYHRDMRRRHNLGHHAWGIVTGLELVETPREGDATAVDVYVQPGMAVDGFGREIIVFQPHKIDPADFDAFTNLLHREVWIAFDEALARRPAAGYELCDVAKQFGRVRETFRIVVEPGMPRHDPVVVAGKEVGPPPPPHPGDLTIPLDESVPYQEFPAEETTPRWLVRLGSVNWDGPNHKFVQAAPGRLLEMRHYVGAIAAEVLAPAATLRIRDRATDPLPAGGEDGAALGGVKATVEGSLQVERLLTAKGDVQIHGRTLDFRDRNGDGGGKKLTMRREESGGAGGLDLQIKIGDDSAGKNRLVVKSGNNDKVSIADNGNTEIKGDVSIRDQKNLLLDGGRLNIQKQGSISPDWALKIEGENLQFVEPDDGDRVVFEVLDASGDLSNPIIRLHGQASATLSAAQLIDLTDGGDTTLHTHPGATTLQKGMVEIAAPGETGSNGESGARLVMPANDPRLLSQAQKDALTGGGLTSLHRHPNCILHNVRSVLLAAQNSHRTDIVEVDLGTSKRVVAFIHLRGMDPLASFDQGDGYFADIFRIDGARPGGQYWFDGDHFGADGADSNMMIAVYTGTAQRLTFRLRTMQDADVWAVGIVFFEDL